MANEGKRSSREEWRKRIERWRDSGLSAGDFASELGVKEGTLRHWRYILGNELRSSEKRTTETEGDLPIVEVRATRIEPSQHFELQLSDQRWLKIPAHFERAALERILAIVERKP